jgi:ketosteroid isomerase-like protein
MRRSRIFVAILLGFSLTAGYWLSAQSANKEMDKLRATIKEFSEAYGTINIDKIVGLYSEDASYLIPDMEILKGRPAIKAYLAGTTASSIEFKQQVVELKIEGNLGYEITNQIVTVHMKDQPARTFPNKFIHLWQKQKDGTWQVLIDMVNSRPTKN